MSTLYQLSARYEAILNKDELNEEDEEMLDQLQDNAEDKAIAIGFHLQNLEAEAEMLANEIKKLDERLDKISDKVEYWKNYTINHLSKFNINKITKCPNFKINLLLNPVKVDDYDVNLIPDRFWKIKEVFTKSIDKTAIRIAIESGETVPGAQLIRTYKLEIK